MTQTTETREDLLSQLAELEAAEPDCECTQCAVDEMDPLYCDFHNGESWWNRETRRVLDALDRIDAERKPMTAIQTERKVA
jgi:hypothetical protein